MPTTKLYKFKTCVILLITFLASAAYAAAINEFVNSADISLPLIFNGIVPSGAILYVGKKIVDRLENHGDRITIVETHISDCPNCPGGVKKK